jgi:YD repeat-containing protein
MAGGLNSTQALDNITLNTPLQPGDSFYYEIKFGVQTTGNFRWNINAEVALANDLSVDPSGDNFSAARLDAANRTGSPGEDLASRNFNWSLPLVSLPGRAGLDLGLSLSYNSLVWTKSGSAIKFDADRGFPGPGFRLGFPVIEPRYYDIALSTNAYLMITPSGSRVQLRQVGSSNIYESGDSSYLQLTDNGSSLLLRSTDGSQLSYTLINGAYRCTQLKDRNGNFITASYTTQGKLSAVLDTLGRTINFNYDGNQNLTSITQTWNGGTSHTWATFGYTDLTIQYNFTGIAVVGPVNGTVIPSLTHVGLADGSKFNFTYNTWGQVYRIGRSTPHETTGVYAERSYTSYNLPVNASLAKDDCPRFTEKHDWAANWGDATTSFSLHNFEGGVTTVTLPDNTQDKEFFGTTGGSAV